MTKTPNFGERIKALRGALGAARGKDMSQAEFAELLDVTQATVSAWEIGDEERAPGPRALLSLASIAPYPESLWFLDEAGFDKKMRLAVSHEILKGSVVLKRETLQGRDAGSSLLVPAELISDPASTRAIVIDEKISGVFSTGDVVVLDESANAAKDLKAFWGQVVLLEVRHAEPGAESGRWWPHNGLYMGRLDLKVYASQIQGLVWAALLNNIFDAETIMVGLWQYQIPTEVELGITGRPKDARQLERIVKEAKEKAPTSLRLAPGCRILGRLAAWYPSENK